MEKQLCECGKKCSIITDISNFQKIYVCQGQSVSKSDKSSKKSLRFCSFVKRHPIEINETLWNKTEITNVIIPRIKPRKSVQYIINMINYFLEYKKFSTLQEIENECKCHKIQTFDPENETMYEFICRVKKTFQERENILKSKYKTQVI